jgi:hypothetical protein
MEADLFETIQLAPDRKRSALRSNIAGLPASEEDLGRAAGGSLLEIVIRVIFERELQQLLNADRNERDFVDVEPDPLDEQLQGLIGKYFPRAGRLTTFIYRKLQRGLDKQRLRLRVHREFYRALYRCARYEERPLIKASLDASVNSQEDPVSIHFFRLLGSMLGVEDARSDLDRLDRNVRAIVDWCLSILPYHRPALGDQDLFSLITNARGQPGWSRQ